MFIPDVSILQSLLFMDVVWNQFSSYVILCKQQRWKKHRVLYSCKSKVTLVKMYLSSSNSKMYKYKYTEKLLNYINLSKHN